MNQYVAQQAIPKIKSSSQFCSHRVGAVTLHYFCVLTHFVALLL